MLGKKPWHAALQIFVERIKPFAEEGGLKVFPQESGAQISEVAGNEISERLLEAIKRVAAASALEAGTQHAIYALKRRSDVHVAFGPDAKNIKSMAWVEDYPSHVVGTSPDFAERLDKVIGGEMLKKRMGVKPPFRERFGLWLKKIGRFFRR